MRIDRWILSKLSRITSSGRFIPEIDGLRFVAIIGVLAFHSLWYFFQGEPVWGKGIWNSACFVLRQGWFGVQLFFIISGFILASPFAERRLSDRPALSLKKYFLRRVTRLEPPYIINLILMMWLAVWVDGKDFSNLLPHLGAGMIYQHNVIYWQENPVNNVTWTLEIEVQFYVLAPLLCMVFSVPNRLLRRGIVVLGIAISCWLSTRPWGGELNMTLLGQFRFFLVGFLLADLYLVEWRSAPARTFWWDLISLPAWLLTPFLISGPGEWPTWVLPPVLLAAYIGAFRGRVIRAIFVSPWIVAIGGMCYSIYLYHIHMIWRARYLIECYITGPVDMNDPWLCALQFLLTAVLVLAACSILFVLFEKPFMRKEWPQQLAARARWVWSVLPWRSRPAPALAVEEEERPRE